MMIPKAMDQIEKDDLDAIVRDEVQEGRSIEFKQGLTVASDSEKKEFLADVTSFANAGGGDRVLGIREEDGVAVEATGIADFNSGRDTLRLESMIRDGVEPRVPGIKFRAIPGFTVGPILVIRIPRSWAGPHMVTFKNASRLFTRSSNGKFQMDVTEIRAAFEGSAELSDRIGDWCNERLGRIVANNGPVRLGGDSCLVVHIIPAESMSDQWRIHVTDMAAQGINVRTIGVSSWDERINVEGVVTVAPEFSNRALARAYTQVFESGRIEAVTCNLLQERDGVHHIASIWYEDQVMTVVADYLNSIKPNGIQPRMP